MPFESRKFNTVLGGICSICLRAVVLFFVCIVLIRWDKGEPTISVKPTIVRNPALDIANSGIVIGAQIFDSDGNFVYNQAAKEYVEL